MTVLDLMIEYLYVWSTLCYVSRQNSTDMPLVISIFCNMFFKFHQCVIHFNSHGFQKISMPFQPDYYTWIPQRFERFHNQSDINLNLHFHERTLVHSTTHCHTTRLIIICNEPTNGKPAKQVKRTPQPQNERTLFRQTLLFSLFFGKSSAPYQSNIIIKEYYQ